MHQSVVYHGIWCTVTHWWNTKDTAINPVSTMPASSCFHFLPFLFQATFRTSICHEYLHGLYPSRKLHGVTSQKPITLTPLWECQISYLQHYYTNSLNITHKLHSIYRQEFMFIVNRFLLKYIASKNIYKNNTFWSESCNWAVQ